MSAAVILLNRKSSKDQCLGTINLGRKHHLVGVGGHWGAGEISARLRTARRQARQCRGRSVRPRAHHWAPGKGIADRPAPAAMECSLLLLLTATHHNRCQMHNQASLLQKNGVLPATNALTRTQQIREACMRSTTLMQPRAYALES